MRGRHTLERSTHTKATQTERKPTRYDDADHGDGGDDDCDGGGDDHDDGGGDDGSYGSVGERFVFNT